MRHDELGGGEPAMEIYFNDFRGPASAGGGEAAGQDALQPCPSCGGTGRVMLLTSPGPCEDCRGTGKAAVQYSFETHTCYDVEEGVDEIIYLERIYVGGRLVKTERTRRRRRPPACLTLPWLNSMREDQTERNLKRLLWGKRRTEQD